RRRTSLSSRGAGAATASSCWPVLSAVIPTGLDVLHRQIDHGHDVRGAMNARGRTGEDTGQQQQQHHCMSKRDIDLPLDIEALHNAEVVYITDRLLTMGHPHLQLSVDGDITPNRKLAAVGHMLRKRHGGHYMVWNLSKVDYDAYMLDDMVLSYKFLGSPSPPLGLLPKLLMAIESWLKANSRNVAMVHCLTGRGRTSTVLAAFLCWMGEAGFHDINNALSYIVRCKRLSIKSLTIPSQVRYAGYFANMLNGVRPSSTPLTLKRIIMSKAPKFAAEPDVGKDSAPSLLLSLRVWGCVPYLQLFKAGNLIFTAAASGGVLLRCRHMTKSGQRIRMFRVAFHTGYVPSCILRLMKAQLDGACEDRRFDEGFFVDLIFEACNDASVVVLTIVGDDRVTTSVVGGDGGGSGDGDGRISGGGEGGTVNKAAMRRSMGTMRTGMVVSASAYDSMLHRYSCFWDVITERIEENMRRQK
ncbi:hypothetical protein ACHAXA_006656, partial [Cyclostephanos tholiformis]